MRFKTNCNSSSDFKEKKPRAFRCRSHTMRNVIDYKCNRSCNISASKRQASGLINPSINEYICVGTKLRNSFVAGDSIPAYTSRVTRWEEWFIYNLDWNVLIRFCSGWPKQLHPLHALLSQFRLKKNYQTLLPTLTSTNLSRDQAKTCLRRADLTQLGQRMIEEHSRSTWTHPLSKAVIGFCRWSVIVMTTHRRRRL